MFTVNDKDTRTTKSLGFTPHKDEQPLQGMEFQEKEEYKDLKGCR